MENPVQFENKVTLGNLISVGVALIVAGSLLANVATLKSDMEKKASTDEMVNVMKEVQKKADQQVLNANIETMNSNIAHIKEIVDIYARANGLSISSQKPQIKIPR